MHSKQKLHIENLKMLKIQTKNVNEHKSWFHISFAFWNSLHNTSTCCITDTWTNFCCYIVLTL